MAQYSDNRTTIPEPQQNEHDFRMEVDPQYRQQIQFEAENQPLQSSFLDPTMWALGGAAGKGIQSGVNGYKMGKQIDKVNSVRGLNNMGRRIRKKDDWSKGQASKMDKWADGDTIKAYHGSRRDHPEFDPSFNRASLSGVSGSHFSKSADTASGYAQHSGAWGSTGRMTPDTSVKNTFMSPQPTGFLTKKGKPEIQDLKVPIGSNVTPVNIRSGGIAPRDAEVTPQMLDDMNLGWMKEMGGSGKNGATTMDDILKFPGETLAENQLRTKILQQKGYSGIHGYGPDEIVMFPGNNVKSSFSKNFDDSSFISQ